MDASDEPEPYLSWEHLHLILPLIGGFAGVYIGIDMLVDPRVRANPKHLALDELVLGMTIILIGLFWIGLITLGFIVHCRRVSRERRELERRANGMNVSDDPPQHW